jgi:hypothetical protein
MCFFSWLSSSFQSSRLAILLPALLPRLRLMALDMLLLPAPAIILLRLRLLSTQAPQQTANRNPAHHERLYLTAMYFFSSSSRLAMLLPALLLAMLLPALRLRLMALTQPIILFSAVR